MTNISTSLKTLTILAAVLVAVSCSKAPAPSSSDEVNLSEAGSLYNSPASPEASLRALADVIAVVDGVEITRGQLEQETRALLAQLSQRFPPEQLVQMRDQVSAQALDQAINKTLLSAAVEQADTQVDQKEIDDVLAKITASLGPDTSLADRLAQLQVTEETLRENIRKDLAIGNYLEAQVGEIAEPTTEEITAFYNEDPSRFEMPEMVNARHILVAFSDTDDEAAKADKKEKAETLRQRVVEGEDFAAVAEAESDDASKSRGGELGSFPRGVMVPPFEEAAFSQEINEVGPVVESPFGYHVIQVIEKQAPRTLSIEETSDRIAQFLTAQKRREKVDNLVKGLRDSANIEMK
ncbi:MAG: peptidylprolyl isomerase [Verrucomicrobia bacterium]|nr:peptidylprolyl isomerase [Verrucomicrobiota bacterium]